MAPDATLIAIDTNADFIRYLRGKFTDSRLFPVTGSAADVRQIIADCGFEHADYVLSGLPFSTLPTGVGPKIAAETACGAAPGRRLPRLSIHAKAPRLHGRPFRADRPRPGMDEHSALPALLGLEGLTIRPEVTAPKRSSAEIEPPRDIIIRGRDHEIAEAPS